MYCKAKSLDLIISIDVDQEIWAFVMVLPPCQSMAAPILYAFRVKLSKILQHAVPMNKAICVSILTGCVDKF